MTRLRLALVAIVVIAGGMGYQQVNAAPGQTERASSALLDDPKPPRVWPSTTTTTLAPTTTTAAPTTPASPSRRSPSPAKPKVPTTPRPTAAPTPPPPPAPAPAPMPASVDAGAEGYVLQRLRADRGGSKPIDLSAGARSVARNWSSRMASQSRMTHNGNLRNDLNRAGVTGWTVVGENLGSGPTIEKVYEALKASSDHWPRMMNGEFTQVGIGVVRQGGTLWLTMDFVGY